MGKAKDKIKIGLITSLGTILTAILILSFTIIMTQNSLYTGITGLSMKIISNSEKENDFAASIAAICGKYTTDYRRVKCVVDNMDPFTYIGPKLDATIEEFIKNKGGDCKSWSLFYYTVFTKLGYDAEYDFISDKHVMLKIWDDNLTFYATIDQHDFTYYDFRVENKT